MSSIAEDGSNLDGVSGMEAYQIKLHDKMGTSSHYKHPLQTRWRRIVQDYTHRDITKGTDKLPAISGLAQKVQEDTKDKYLAGLWLNHLHNDLFWFAMGDMKPASPFRAPSWSWAAFDGSITYDAVMDMKTVYYVSNMESVNGECKPSTFDRLGQVSEGHLRLRGRLRKAVVSTVEPRKDDMVAKHTRELYNCPKQSGQEHEYSLGYGALDAVSSTEREVVCLSVAIKASDPGPYHQVLLLELVGSEPNVYRRLGAAFIRPKDWFDSCSAKEVILI